MSLNTERIEHDLLGDRALPAHAYYGVHTLRAVENFPITATPIAIYPELVRSPPSSRRRPSRTASWGCSTPNAPKPSSGPAWRSAPASCTTSSWWT
jgi:hypothetical protein